MAGPQWTPLAANRWSPYIQVLAGGQKVTCETADPEAEEALRQSLDRQGKTLAPSDHSRYTAESAVNTFTMSAGAGVDLRLNSAFAVRLGSVDYMYSASNRRGFQVTSGLVLRIGTW
jgi:hypothetical protein